MINPTFLHSDFFNWVILPLLIFLSRLMDVTLGTLRHILLSRGIKKIVPVLGFFEVLIWIVVIAQIMKNLNNIMCYFAWAGGFATGTLVGILIEEKLAIGMQVIRIITNQDCTQLIDALQKEDLGVTVIDGYGGKGPVKIIFTVIKRKNFENVAKLIQQFNPTAFYSIEDVREANQGVFPRTTNSFRGFNYFSNLFPTKGK